MFPINPSINSLIKTKSLAMNRIENFGIWVGKVMNRFEDRRKEIDKLFALLTLNTFPISNLIKQLR